MHEIGESGSVIFGRFPSLGIPETLSPEEKAAESFSDILSESIGTISELERERDALTLDLALGKPVELHEVMLASTKASMALELFIEIRNKLIEAYQEISRMPV